VSLIFLQRFRDWFTNHANTNGGNGGARQNNILDLSSSKGTRRESSYHVYYDIHKKRLKPEIEADFEEHKKECLANGTTALLPIARRNQFLSKKLQTETKEIQEEVQAKIKESISNSDATAVDVLAAETEEDRVAKAKTLQS
jgi:hypothetical protein